MILYILWSALCWRLRGGLISDITQTLFNFRFGTGVTRIVTSGLMAAPLGFYEPVLLTLWLSIYASMCIGYFDRSMGLEEPWRDHLFLTLWGIVVAAIMLLPLTYIYSPTIIFLSLVGGLVSLAYTLNKIFLGLWTERAELVCGAIFGTLILIGIKCFY